MPFKWLLDRALSQASKVSTEIPSGRVLDCRKTLITQKHGFARAPFRWGRTCDKVVDLDVQEEKFFAVHVSPNVP